MMTDVSPQNDSPPHSVDGLTGTQSSDTHFSSLQEVTNCASLFHIISHLITLSMQECLLDCYQTGDSTFNLFQQVKYLIEYLYVWIQVADI